MGELYKRGYCVVEGLCNRAVAQVTVFFFSGDGGQVAGLRSGDDGTAMEQRRRQRAGMDGGRSSVDDGRRAAKTAAKAFSDAGDGRRTATGTEGGSGPAVPAIDPRDGDGADGKRQSVPCFYALPGSPGSFG
ncbi:hypothetical protein MRB53_007910 [Persea americana]|uniref:Uncharacterized protein n=1 Tax=Persea americana TaxID=3435 RepID=A0ACC2MKB1_PERAE|nr:hypothetical protein MRB53_007910 [Persea americana]